MSLQPKSYEEAKARFKPMRRRHGAPRECQQDGPDGEICGFTAYSSRGMGVHQRRAHGLPTLHKRTKRLGPGKKTKAWDTARATIKRRFEKAGITTCELRGVLKHDCKIDDWLSFAHDAKRRKLRPEDLSHVILCCTIGHDIIEVWPPEKMKAIVNETIQNRKAQP